MNAVSISSPLPQVGLFSHSSCMPVATARNRITPLKIQVNKSLLESQCRGSRPRGTRACASTGGSTAAGNDPGITPARGGRPRVSAATAT